MLMTHNFAFRSNRLVFTNLQKLFLQPSVTLFLGHTTTNSCSLLNPSKTELLLIGTSQKRKKLSDVTSISLDNTTIPVSTSARNLGFIFDSDMSLTSQVNLVSKSSHFHIRDIRRIRNLIPISIAITLANSLVSSRLDYCNSLYFGMSKQNIQKLLRIKFSCAGHPTNFKVSAHHTSSQRSPLAPYHSTD